MNFVALATDYDGTIATDGVVDQDTAAALGRLKASGRKLILVTGRELPHLEGVFDRLDLFDKVVAENGAVLYTPATREERLLAPAPDPAFVRRLEELGVAPLSVGRAIVATWEPHDAAVLTAMRELGLELQITFNKGAVMVLPAGVNKASGLASALEELAISPHDVVGIGDAENDYAFLRACGAAVAVANALPALQESADLVTPAARGAGVAWLVDRLIAVDADAIPRGLERSRIRIGHDEDGG